MYINIDEFTNINIGDQVQCQFDTTYDLTISDYYFVKGDLKGYALQTMTGLDAGWDSFQGLYKYYKLKR